MSVNPVDLPDSMDGGAEYPSDPKGWRTMRLDKYRAEAKGDRVWFLLEFSDENGGRASASQNLFTKPKTDGEGTANSISLRLFKTLWEAAGLTETDFPAPNPAAIAKALNAYEGELKVDAYCGPDGRGYTQATKFRKVKPLADGV